MKQPTLMQIDQLPVAQIEHGSRLRPVSEAAVESLIASINELGVMKDAIHVRKRKDGRFVLIAGAHRLEAARRLGWAEVPVKVWTDITDDWARLMEIDDNIAGAELSPLDTALFLAERKRLYEKLHPEARRGLAGAVARWDATDTMSVAFTTATAEKFSMTDRHVRRLIAAGERLDPRDVQLLRKAPRPVTLKDLGEIAKIGEPAERYDVVEALAEGHAKSASEARRKWREAKGATPVSDPVETELKALLTAWKRASKVARRRFVAAAGGELQRLLDDEAKMRGAP